jgi:hypothetical protein
MFIDRATAKGFSSLQRSETYAGLTATVGNIALRRSANCRVQVLCYKHLAPLGRRGRQELCCTSNSDAKAYAT